MACDVLLIVAMIIFLLKYHKTMQAMLAAFLQMNTKNTGIQSVQADQIGRTYPPLFTLNVQIETFCCIFKCIRINWLSIIVTGISGTMITMSDIAYVLIFTDNDLTNITEDHFKIKLIARLLDQIYVVQPPMFLLRYDDAPLQEYEYSYPNTSTDGTRPSAPQFPEHLHSLLTRL